MKLEKDGFSEKYWLTFQDKQNQPSPIIDNICKNALLSAIISVLAVLQDNRNLNMNPEPCLMA